MAVKINIATTTMAGLPVPVGSLVAFDLKIARPLKELDAEQNVTYSVVLTYELYPSMSVSAYLEDPTQSMGRIQEYDQEYTKKLTSTELTALRNDGSIAEAWLKEYLESKLGVNTCVVIDPFAQ